MIDWKLRNEEETGVKKKKKNKKTPQPCQVSGLGKWVNEHIISETGNTIDKAIWEVRGW